MADVTVEHCNTFLEMLCDAHSQPDAQEQRWKLWADWLARHHHSVGAAAAAAAATGAASMEQEADKAVLAPTATVGGTDSCQAPGRGTALSMNAIVLFMASFYIVNTAQYYQILRT